MQAVQTEPLAPAQSADDLEPVGAGGEHGDEDDSAGDLEHVLHFDISVSVSRVCFMSPGQPV